MAQRNNKMCLNIASLFFNLLMIFLKKLEIRNQKKNKSELEGFNVQNFEIQNINNNSINK